MVERGSSSSSKWITTSSKETCRTSPMFHLPGAAVIKSYTEEGIHKNYTARKSSQITMLTYMCALALLPREAEMVVILVYALQTSQTFFKHNAPFTDPTLSNLLDGCILKPVDLPPEEQWSVANDRAGAILGLAISPLRNSNNVA